jgi:FemAB-related protein (PEP-CTERM system-associated)
MTRVRAYADSDRERWDAFVRGAEGSHFGQLIAWRQVVEESFGCRPHYWLAEEAGRVTGVLPLFEKRGPLGGRSLFSPPGGLLADDAATAEALLEPARERVRAGGHDWLELRDQRRRWEGLVTVEEHVTMELALPDDPATLWAGFDAKLRNQIRKGEKAAFRVRWGHEHVGDFHRVMLENMRDLGTPILGEDYYTRVLERLGGDADVLVIDRDGEPAGAMFVVSHAGTLADPWASSLRRFFAHCPNQVLYWEAIRHGIERGARRFDFGRSQSGSGTYRFKEQWLARPVRLYYQYALGRAASAPTLEEQKHQFDLAVKVWRRLPLPVAGLLGRGVKRLFPEAL